MSTKKTTPSFGEHLKAMVSSHHKAAPVSSANAIRYTPDPDMGLTATQVEKRTEQGYNNHMVDKSTKSVAKIICSNVLIII